MDREALTHHARPLADTVTRRDALGFCGMVGAAAALAAIPGSADAQPAGANTAKPSPRPSLPKARSAVQAARDTILRISREVWSKPAIGLQEHEAMEVHIRELQAAGFTITHREAGGHPTAFVAEWSLGSGGPKLGFLPEYDALPGLGNAAEPEQKPTADGDTDGHGCGHNCLGAACTGAAIALKAVMESQNLAGTVRVYGCGAEENFGAKVFLAKAGLVDDLDAAIAWHPTAMPLTGTGVTAANRKIFITWKGRTAHAGESPWDGRSALKAAELFTHGLNMMREHLRPTSRMHYIYEIAGVAPNVVPDEARIWMVARDNTSELVDATVDWLRQLAQGTALGMQTQATFEVPLGMKELISSETFALRIWDHMQHVPLDWTDEEHAFAKKCQKAFGLPEAGMATKILPLLKDVTTGGSTDVADICWITPTALFGWPTFPIGISAHTWAVTACGGMSIGDKGTLAAAAIMTALAIDLLTEPDLRIAAREEHARRRKGRPYAATLNIGPDTINAVPKRFAKGMGDEVFTGLDR